MEDNCDLIRSQFLVFLRVVVIGVVFNLCSAEEEADFELAYSAQRFSEGL